MIVSVVAAAEDVDVDDELIAVDDSAEANEARPEPDRRQLRELLPNDKIQWELSTSD